MIIFFTSIFLSNFVCYIYYLYLYQLKGYFYIRFLKLLIKNKTILASQILFLLSILINLFLIKNNLIFILFNSILNLLFATIFLIKLLKNKKIKLKFTQKIIRNIVIFSIILIFLLLFGDFFEYFIYFNYLFIILINLFDFYKIFETIYFNIKSKKFIKTNSNIIKIGITGSNGKTSIKNILYHLIKDDIPTIATPKNFNTPQGIKYTICKLCNSDTQCAIFEMGARKNGDIKKLCSLTKVDIGILSNISLQHIETFKSVDNVFKTKCELPNFLGDKLCVYNFNDRLSYSAYKQKIGEKILVGILSFSYAIKSKKTIKIKHTKLQKKFKITLPKFDIFAKNIFIKNGLTHFTLVSNKEYKLETRLLGKHNISNILQAVAVAKYLGLKIETLVHKIATIPPTPHRLEFIKSHINILDDSYNCSIASAKNSLDVLACFPNKKVCCTPGIVEGGHMQFELNVRLAKMMKQKCDIQIIVGKTNRTAFSSVLKKSAYFVDTLNDAKKLFSKLRQNDTLLILNDLPDDYD